MKTLEISPERHKRETFSRPSARPCGRSAHERGLTLKQVAEGAHVSVSYLAEIERGEKDPSSRVLESIARGLDVEVSELLVRIASALEPAPVVRHRLPGCVRAARVRAVREPLLLRVHPAEKPQHNPFELLGLLHARHVGRPVHLCESALWYCLASQPRKYARRIPSVL